MSCAVRRLPTRCDGGNRLSVIDGGGTTPYVTNALNQYTSANGTYYQYDTSGNMIYDGHYVFDYDPENRLNKVLGVVLSQIMETHNTTNPIRPR